MSDLYQNIISADKYQDYQNKVLKSQRTQRTNQSQAGFSSPSGSRTDGTKMHQKMALAHLSPNLRNERFNTLKREPVSGL